MYNHNYLRRHNNSLVVCMWLLASNTTEVNDLRYQLFCAKRGEIESSLLLPCRDCLFMHLLRANYQAAIWKCCLHARPTVPDPTKCGLIDDDGNSPFTGCGRHQHQMLSWYCWLVSVSVPVSCQRVHAWHMDYRAQTCASCSHEVTRNSRKMKMTSSNSVIQTMI